MQLLEALQHFGEREEPHEPFLVNGVDMWLECCTAMVSLSGGLEDAKNDGDLDELVDHCQSLLAIGVVTAEDVDAEMTSVMRAVEQFLAESWKLPTLIGICTKPLLMQCYSTRTITTPKKLR